MSNLDHKALASHMYPAVIAAGRLALEHRRRGVRTVHKADGSPVTVADQEAEAVLLASLLEALPGVPILSEEAESQGGRAEEVGTAGLLAMVDPLDGTREYIRGGEDFTVNVGVALDGVPVFGIILQPTSGRLFATIGAAEAIEADATAALAASGGDDLSLASPRRIATRAPDPRSLRALASRSRDNAETVRFLARYPIRETGRIGSSLKFCLIAAGEADLYPRFGPTCVWDTCAGQAILAAAGGCVTTIAGEPLRYKRLVPPYLNPAFVAWGRPETAGLTRG